MGAATAGVPLRELGLMILVAAALTYITTGIVRAILVRSEQMAEIRDRDVHTHPIPRLGGVAMFTGAMAAIYVADQFPALTRGFQPVTPEMNAVVWGAFVIVVVGVLDDLYELDAITKLLGQVLAGVVMSLLGISWTVLYVPFGGGTTVVLDQTSSMVLTVLVTVTLINAFNFVDGIDGLAAGLGMIAAGATLLFSLTVLHDQGGMVSAYPPAIIAAAVVGMCAGFLPHNFEPARIFMGDTGAMLIGLMLAAASISASGKIDMSLYGAVDMIALLSPVIVVIGVVFVPMLDLVMAVVRRVRRGQSPFSADKMHLHHRLLSLGHTHRRVVLVLYSWALVVAFGAVSFSIVPPLAAVVGIVLAALAAMALTWQPVRRAVRETQRGGSRRRSGKKPGRHSVVRGNSAPLAGGAVRGNSAGRGSRRSSAARPSQVATGQSLAKDERQASNNDEHPFPEQR